MQFKSKMLSEGLVGKQNSSMRIWYKHCTKTNKLYVVMQEDHNKFVAEVIPWRGSVDETIFEGDSIWHAVYSNPGAARTGLRMMHKIHMNETGIYKPMNMR